MDGVAFYRVPWKSLEPGSNGSELHQIGEDPTEQVDRAAEDPSVVEKLADALSAFPRGPSINRSLWRAAWDPDFFGCEHREPWADPMN